MDSFVCLFSELGLDTLLFDVIHYAYLSVVLSLSLSHTKFDALFHCANPFAMIMGYIFYENRQHARIHDCVLNVTGYHHHGNI